LKFCTETVSTPLRSSIRILFRADKRGCTVAPAAGPENIEKRHFRGSRQQNRMGSHPEDIENFEKLLWTDE
jgi:hypothetical protein